MSFGFISKQNIRNSIKGAENTPATSSYLGTVRVDGVTVLIDLNGTISIVTATSSITGVVRPDGTSVLINNGIISVATIPVATTAVAGTVRPDGTSVLINNGIISVATVQGDSTSIVVSSGVIQAASGSNGYGLKTVQSVATGVPSNSIGNNGDIIYQY